MAVQLLLQGLLFTFNWWRYWRCRNSKTHSHDPIEFSLKERAERNETNIWNSKILFVLSSLSLRLGWMEIDSEMKRLFDKWSPECICKEVRKGGSARGRHWPSMQLNISRDSRELWSWDVLSEILCIEARGSLFHSQAHWLWALPWEGA